ncbi:hypothetical protein, partial [Helicobacter turcicus]
AFKKKQKALNANANLRDLKFSAKKEVELYLDKLKGRLNRGVLYVKLFKKDLYLFGFIILTLNLLKRKGLE